MNKGTKTILITVVVAIIFSLGLWYLLSTLSGGNFIYNAISNISNGEFFPQILSTSLMLGMGALAICCLNTVLALPELIQGESGSVLSIVFIIIRSIFAIAVCVFISISLTQEASTVVGKILYVLLAIVLTALIFAPTVLFIIKFTQDESIQEGIKGFLIASLCVVGIAALFVPAVIVVVVFVAIKILGAIFSGYSPSSNSSSTKKRYSFDDGTGYQELTQDVSNPNIWYDQRGNKVVIDEETGHWHKL